MAERTHMHHCDREHSPRRRRVDSAAGAAARRAPRGTPSPWPLQARDICTRRQPTTQRQRRRRRSRQVSLRFHSLGHVGMLHGEFILARAC
eukprot:3189058-Prymnesium_polylepis.1